MTLYYQKPIQQLTNFNGYEDVDDGWDTETIEVEINDDQKKTAILHTLMRDYFTDYDKETQNKIEKQLSMLLTDFICDDQLNRDLEEYYRTDIELYYIEDYL